MNFLYPGFLFSLAAIAIPILIHLFNFKRFRKVYFSNIQFLKEVEQKNSSRQKLKNLLILFARIFAIVFLVLAFAQPYIPGKEKFDAASHPIVGIYVDNSFSMESVSKEGALLDVAKRRAKEIASSFSLNSKFKLETNDFEGKHQRLLSYDDFVSAIDEIKISAASRKLQQMLDRQQDYLSDKPGKKVVYLLSDFQDNMFDSGPIEVDSTVSLKAIHLSANSLANISVDSVWFVSPIHKPSTTENLVVQLKNNSDKEARNVAIKLNINNQQKAIGNISLQARKTGKDTLSFSGLNPGWKQGEISITDYPVVFDDKFYFSFHVRENMPILSVNQTQPNRYLQAVYGADSFFKLDNTTAGNINYSSLRNYPLIILNDLNSISSGLSQQLAAYIRSGGNVMIFPSLTANTEAFRTFLQVLGTDVPEQIVDSEAKVTTINLKHPMFYQVFDRLPRNLDLPVAKKFIQYSNQNRTTKQNILELAGRRSFLSQYNLGQGRIYLSAVPLDEQVTNFVQHSIFVPVMYQAAFLSLRENRLFYVLGRDQYLEITKTALKPNQILKLKKETFETIPDLQQTESSTKLFIADQIREEGIYQLFKADSLAGFFAFNNNRLESDLSYADDKFILSKFPEQKIEIFAPGKEATESAIKTVANGSQLWKLCIILSLICIAVEVLLIRFLKPKF